MTIIYWALQQDTLVNQVKVFMDSSNCHQTIKKYPNSNTTSPLLFCDKISNHNKSINSSQNKHISLQLFNWILLLFKPNKHTHRYPTAVAQDTAKSLSSVCAVSMSVNFQYCFVAIACTKIQTTQKYISSRSSSCINSLNLSTKKNRKGNGKQLENGNWKS